MGILIENLSFYYTGTPVLEQVNLSRKKPLGSWFYPMAKYLFCGVTLVVLVLGAVSGGIG